MKPLQFLFVVISLLGIHFSQGQNTSKDEMMNFKNVWFYDNREELYDFQLSEGEKTLSYLALFTENDMIFFTLDVNGICQCTFTLDRKYVVKRITDDSYYYETEYVYAEFRNIPPIEKLRSKKIPVKVWFNRKNHRVTIKIGKKVVADKTAYFSETYAGNRFWLKNGTATPSATSVK
jgi:hypothetical protein